MDRADNTGVLFINDKKVNEAQPDYKGKLKVNNAEYYVSGWKRANEEGSYISFKLRPVEAETII